MSVAVSTHHHHNHDDALLRALRSYKFTLIYLCVMATIIVVLLVLNVLGVLPNIETPAVSTGGSGGITIIQGSTHDLR